MKKEDQRHGTRDMRIYYIANARMPTEKTHGLHIAKMCEAFAACGAEVTLVLSRRKNVIAGDVFAYYGILRNFDVQYIPVWDLVGKGFFGYWLTQLSFSFGLLRHFWSKKTGMVITRDELSGWMMSKRGFRVFYDMHGFPERWRSFSKVAMKQMAGIICTNEWKIGKLRDAFGIQEDMLLLARNGFDASAFDRDISKEDARRSVGLPLDGNIVMYTGHLYDWKGVDVLARAASSVRDALVVIVGGTAGQVADFQKRHRDIANLVVIGHKPHADMPLYLKAADGLVIPNSRISKNARAIPYSIYDTSPIKLFEYMASKRPIVASNLPSIREVVDEETAVFFEPDNPRDLARSIRAVLHDADGSARRALRAFDKSREYTWERRARRILQFMQR